MQPKKIFYLKYLGIDAGEKAIVYLKKDCVNNNGFLIDTHIKLISGKKSLLALVNTIEGELLKENEIALSKYARISLNIQEGDKVILSPISPMNSLSFVRAKVFGHVLGKQQFDEIINDIVQGQYTDINLATFLTACAGERLTKDELISLTKAMVDVGKTMSWRKRKVVDIHSVGGLPGNCSSLIVVPIVASFGLLIPKVSSRSITSPAGTADTMETLAPVKLDFKSIRKIVEKENGCIVDDGGNRLSPADDILIKIEHNMDLASEGQMITSILSKKISAGSTHIVIDMPIGPTAKIRTLEAAHRIKNLFCTIGDHFNLKSKVVFSDGSQPIGGRIGPALEAKIKSPSDFYMSDLLKVWQTPDILDKPMTVASLVAVAKNKNSQWEWEGTLAPLAKLLPVSFFLPLIIQSFLKTNEYQDLEFTKEYRDFLVPEIEQKELSKVKRLGTLANNTLYESLLKDNALTRLEQSKEVNVGAVARRIQNLFKSGPDYTVGKYIKKDSLPSFDSKSTSSSASISSSASTSSTTISEQSPLISSSLPQTLMGDGSKKQETSSSSKDNVGVQHTLLSFFSQIPSTVLGKTHLQIIYL